MQLCCIYNSICSKPNGDLFIACHVESGQAWANKSCFFWHHTQLSALFKLNKHAKCSNIVINNQPMWIESNLNLPTCTKACKLISLLLAFFGYLVFFSTSEMWGWYGSALPCNTLLAMLLHLNNYEQCCTRLLKVLHICCNTDVLGVLLIYPYSPSDAAHPQELCLELCIYNFQTPCCSVTIYQCIYTCMHAYTHIYYMYAYRRRNRGARGL